MIEDRRMKTMVIYTDFENHRILNNCCSFQESNTLCDNINTVSKYKHVGIYILMLYLILNMDGVKISKR